MLAKIKYAISFIFKGELKQRIATAYKAKMAAVEYNSLDARVARGLAEAKKIQKEEAHNCKVRQQVEEAWPIIFSGVCAAYPNVDVDKLVATADIITEGYKQKYLN